MLSSIVKPISGSVRHAAGKFYIWALYDVSHECFCRSYHGAQKNKFLPFTGVISRNSKNPSKLILLEFTRAVSSKLDPSLLSHDSEKICDSGKEFLEKHNITVRGEGYIPNPVYNIGDAGFPDFVNNVLRTREIVTPTPVQSITWPTALSGRDVVAISPTGSGKTLAFAIPAIIHVNSLKNGESGNENLFEDSSHKSFRPMHQSTIPSPIAVVLAPTRELAQQIVQVFRWFQSGSVKCSAVYGGGARDRQLYEIYQGVDILVATPGRCNDLLNAGDIELKKCSYVVLDEADRMLDMGFLPQIKPIIERMSEKRQSLMWSATWPKEVVDIATNFLSDYIHISVGSENSRPSLNVKQTVVFCENKAEKMNNLLKFLNRTLSSNDTKVLIFVERKCDVDILENILHTEGFRTGSVHSGKSQVKRENTLKLFRLGTLKVLIATAVAARGLDVDNITHVINYDCPKFSEDYVHKVGRTGRFNKMGEAVTYVTHADTFAGYLINMLKECNEEIPPELLNMKRFLHSNKSYRYSNQSYRKFSNSNNWYREKRMYYQ